MKQYWNMLSKLTETYPKSITDPEDVIEFLISRDGGLYINHFFQFVPILLKRLRDGRDKWPVGHLFLCIEFLLMTCGLPNDWYLSPKWKDLLDIIDQIIELGGKPETLLCAELYIITEFEYPDFPIAFRYGASLCSYDHEANKYLDVSNKWEYTWPIFFRTLPIHVPLIVDHINTSDLTDLTNGKGQTFLHLLADQHIDDYSCSTIEDIKNVFHTLLSLGADISIQDINGRSVVHEFAYSIVSVSNIHFQLYPLFEELILLYKSHLSLEDNKGKTVLDIVGHIPELRLMIETVE
jgi:hypothetical protein